MSNNLRRAAAAKRLRDAEAISTEAPAPQSEAPAPQSEAPAPQSEAPASTEAPQSASTEAPQSEAPQSASTEAPAIIARILMTRGAARVGRRSEEGAAALAKARASYVPALVNGRDLRLTSATVRQHREGAAALPNGVLPFDRVVLIHIADTTAPVARALCEALRDAGGAVAASDAARVFAALGKDAGYLIGTYCQNGSKSKGKQGACWKIERDGKALSFQK